MTRLRVHGLDRWMAPTEFVTSPKQAPERRVAVLAVVLGVAVGLGVGWQRWIGDGARRTEAAVVSMAAPSPLVPDEVPGAVRIVTARVAASDGSKASFDAETLASLVMRASLLAEQPDVNRLSVIRDELAVHAARGEAGADDALRQIEWHLEDARRAASAASADRTAPLVP